MNEIDKILKREKLVNDFYEEYKKGNIHITTKISKQLKELDVYTEFFPRVIQLTHDREIILEIERHK
ncbi:hypothetical protein ES705_44167 [subsurface metagenome]